MSQHPPYGVLVDPSALASTEGAATLADSAPTEYSQTPTLSTCSGAGVRHSAVRSSPCRPSGKGSLCLFGWALMAAACASSVEPIDTELAGPDSPLSLAATEEDRERICDELLVEFLLEPWRECVAATGVGVPPADNSIWIEACHRVVAENLDDLPPDCSLRDAYDCDFLELEYSCAGVPAPPPLPSQPCREAPPSRCSLFVDR